MYQELVVDESVWYVLSDFTHRDGLELPNIAEIKVEADFMLAIFFVTIQAFGSKASGRDAETVLYDL